MLAHVDTRRPSDVEEQVQGIYRHLFPQGDAAFVPRAFDWAAACFSGRLADYQAIDALYHDFEHTLQGTLCLARLWSGRAAAHARPPLDRRMFELSLLAILFHDTGYLKRRDDTAGTGAKYTMTHVDRSADFAEEFLRPNGLPEADIQAIRNMIHCTGVAVDLDSIPFRDDAERLGGFALATADLLGQMGADDYVDKLPILFEEFAEAVRFSGEKAQGLAVYRSADDLLRHTPVFWETYVMPRLTNEFRGLYQFLNHPWPDGTNFYLDKVQRNLDRIRRDLSLSEGAVA